MSYGDAHLAGHCDTRPAQRLTTTIFVLRIILTALVALVTAFAGYIAFRGDTPQLLPVIIGWGVFVTLVLYVTFGWLEQTLFLLIGIAFNTAQQQQRPALIESTARRTAPATRASDPTPKPAHWTDEQESAYQELLRREGE